MPQLSLNKIRSKEQKENAKENYSNTFSSFFGFVFPNKNDIF
jgi:hypothetical protein